MKMRKHRQLFRISFLGLAALMLMSVGVMFFNTHASEAVSDSDLAASSFDLSSGGIHRSPVSSRPSVSESDAAGKPQKAVTQGKTAEPKPMQARTAHISFTAHGPNLGFTINSGSPTTVYIDWGTGAYVKETSSDGFFYKDSIQSGATFRISASSTIKSFISYLDDNSYLKDFDCTQCTTLEELDVSRNMLTYTLDLSALDNLKKLNCSDNSIRELKLSHKAVLTELNCTNNLLRPSTIDMRYGQRGTFVPQGKAESYDVSISSNIIFDQSFDELAPDYSISLKGADGTSYNANTTYKWYRNSTDVTSSVTSLGSGKFQFPHSMLHEYYYCVMKNNQFKDASGNVCEWKTAPSLVAPATYSFMLTLDDNLPYGEFYIDINSDAQNVFVDYSTGNGYYPRHGGHVFAVSARNVRVLRYYAENLTSITLPANCVKAIDLSFASDLKTLIAGDNPSLSSLDLSPCTKLVTVDVGDDGLTSLNMTGLTALASLDASGNKLRFSTVTKPAFFKTGNYSNQHDNSIAIPASVAIGQEIDLSAEYVDGRSVYTWSGGANPAVTGGKAKFTTADIGKTTACVITHPDYPGLEVNTTQTKVIPAEAIFTLTTSNSSGEFSFTLNNDAQKVFVDFGEGFVEKSAGSISGTLSASTVKVYAENVTSLSVPSQHLTGVNLARLTELETLDVSGNPALGMPDLSHNTALTSLNVSGNELTTLDTSALTALATLDASGNKLKFSTVTQPDGFTGGNYSNQDNDPIEIANPVKGGQEIDLSAEYVDGRSVYTWNPTVDFTCANGIISFGDNARGKNVTGTITHPDYSGLTVSVTGIRVMSGFEVDDDGSGVTAEPEDDITLEDADGNPIDIDDVIIRIRHLTADELASEKTAITAKGFVVTDDDTMDGYDISLVDRSGRPVKITGNAGIRIKFPYGGIDRASNTFVLYHNDSVAGIEVIDCSANEDGLEFVGHRFSHYSFVASPNSSGDDSSSSGDDTSSDNGNDGGNKGNKSDVPGTGESPVMLSLAYLLLVISLAGAYFSIYMNRAKETGNHN